MPISIYKVEIDKNKNLEFLCEDSWSLPDQVEALELWLLENHKKIGDGEFVADIGFEIRKDASGGGAVLSKNAMRIMSEIGMDLFLSEYR